jgi:hypothetical protein
VDDTVHSSFQLLSRRRGHDQRCQFDVFLPEFERPKMSARLHTTIALLLLAVAPAACAQTPATGVTPCDSTTPCACRMANGCASGCGMQQMGDMQQMGGMNQMGGMHRMGGMGNMGMMGGMNRQGMPMPSAADIARLDSLVTAMHQTKGDRKLSAMEKVIDELLGQRKLMQDHMKEMMDGRSEK